MKKKLAVGGENFPNMIRNHCYYVDKTGFIRTVMKSESRVLFVTRPRRFVDFLLALKDEDSLLSHGASLVISSMGSCC